MRRVFAMISALIFSATAHSGFPIEATLPEMVQTADHLFVGHVIRVDMIDAKGSQVRDRDAQTGPGTERTIRLHVVIDEVLFTTAAPAPKVLALPLAKHLHYSLGQIQDAHEGDKTARLIFLRGKALESIKPGIFFRPISEKVEAIRLRAESLR